MDSQNLMGLSEELVRSLSPAEKQAVLQILQELGDSGVSQSYMDILKEDYDEIPVDIDTFIENDEFIGIVTQQGSTIYPYWRQRLRDIFSPENDFNEIIFSGAIGIGKTTIAITGMAYILHCLLCLKNPQQYYGLQANSKIIFAFFNVNLDLSYGVAYKKLQSMLMMSPWFQRHGTIHGREDKNKWYLPGKGIEFRVGSQEHHGLGQDIFCLTGDTKVLTNSGWSEIQKLDGRDLAVVSVDDNGNFAFSNQCTVMKTGDVTSLHKITLEDGTVIKCTADHRLRLSDGRYVRVEDLKVGDDIMSFTDVGVI